MRKAVVILPTYNEVDSVKTVIEGIFETIDGQKNWDFEVLVVDSSSEDKTGEIVREMQKGNKRIHIISTKKEGLGKAYINGFQYALDHLKPYLIFEMDADLQHDSKRIPEFLKKIEEGADFVIGSRYIKGGSIPKDWGLHRKIFSVPGNMIIRFGFMKLKITDWTSGFRAVKAWIIKDSISHIKHYSGYVFQIALLDYAVKNHATIKEIPIVFKERQYGISKINAIQYIVQIIMYVLSHSSFIKFVIVGGIGFILDFALSYMFIERMKSAVWFATLISTETAIISNFILNNYWSFSHKRLEHKGAVYLWNFLKFNLVSSGSIAIQTIGMQLLSVIFGRTWWYVYKIIIIFFIVIPYSYILYNKFIWKEKR